MRLHCEREPNRLGPMGRTSSKNRPESYHLPDSYMGAGSMDRHIKNIRMMQRMDVIVANFNKIPTRALAREVERIRAELDK